jgi:hypothetical protein
MHKKLLLGLLAILSLGLASKVLLAVTPSTAELLEEVEPPPKVQEGQPLEDEPEVTIRKEGKKTIQEYRINGELYMMKVTPDHGVSYYLYKEDQQSDWVNVGPNPPLAVPKWTLFRF